ncbi:hypothetical protein, partial [uncultured Treponema sp.]|uniref:hypothetical protein n=1 Tax=uncultured Treponema sp. TaxID=162155 RepID=UPI0026034572
ICPAQSVSFVSSITEKVLKFNKSFRYSGKFFIPHIFFLLFRRIRRSCRRLHLNGKKNFAKFLLEISQRLWNFCNNIRRRKNEF